MRMVDRAELALYGRIVELYGPYVLVRCTRYTNRRRLAQQIGAYTLISTCLAVREVGLPLSLGRTVDIVAGVVGPDVKSRGVGRAWWGASKELLLVDERMRKTARALNTLGASLREVLVLHYVSGLEADELARLWKQPTAEVRATIARAERLLARRLERLGAEGCGPDVQSWLVRFAAGLDDGCIMDVALCVMGYLAACGHRHQRRHRRTDGNRN